MWEWVTLTIILAHRPLGPHSNATPKQETCSVATWPFSPTGNMPQSTTLSHFPCTIHCHGKSTPHAVGRLSAVVIESRHDVQPQKLEGPQGPWWISFCRFCTDTLKCWCHNQEIWPCEQIDLARWAGQCPWAWEENIQHLKAHAFQAKNENECCTLATTRCLKYPY